MPRGIYPRTEKHKEICRKAGQASAQSQVNRDRYASRHVTAECRNCGKEFTKLKSMKKIYCSHECSLKSPEWRAKISAAGIGSAHHTQKHSEEAKQKMRLKKLGKRLSIGTEFAKRGAAWKGTRSEYVALHILVRKVWGKPERCVHCGATDGKLEWANVNHTYRLKRDEWLTLCAQCHIAMDGRGIRNRDICAL